MKRPDLTVDVTLEDGTEHTVKMSYGLFNDLQRTCPDPSAILDTMTSDPYTRDYIIRRCLTPTKKMVTDPDKELIAVEDCGLDNPDQVDKLLNWVTGHMLYFFATSAGGLKLLGEAFKAKLAPDLPARSTTGSTS